MDIRPFLPEMLPDAGALLAERQNTSLIGATRAVTLAYQRPNIQGMAAFEQGRLIAYLFAEKIADMLWGRSLWVRLPNCAVASGTDPEVIRDLYTAVAAPAVRQGYLNHAVILPTSDSALIESFFSLGFGREQVHASIDLQQESVEPPELPDGVTIRQAKSDDRKILESLSPLIWQHQVKAPVWGIHLPETEEQRRAAYGDMADDDTAVVYLAFVEGEPAGLQAYFPVEEDDPMQLLCPGEGLELCVAATGERSRGRGIATTLTRYGFFAAAQSGCRVIRTDWRSTNLLSSRFWPKRGFKPVAYRLTRRVDDRILWAGERPGRFVAGEPIKG